MKKQILTLLFLISAVSLFPVIEWNDLYEPGLVEKNGIYGYQSPLYNNSFQFITGVKTDNTSYISLKTRMLINPAELWGFFYLGEFHINKISGQSSEAGDLSWFGGLAPYLGESYIGQKNQYFKIHFGFQNLRSTDAIYHHLMLDDYSGSMLALRGSGMFSRFFDFDISYIILRPNKSSWLNGKAEFDPTIFNPGDETLYDGLYGKSLYFHKFNIRPLPWMRFGLLESVFFLGENFNPWFMNAFSSYYLSQLMGSFIAEKSGSRFNLHASDMKLGFDWNIGFSGWRFYGEFMMDDSNGEFFKFAQPSHPDKVAFLLGGEIRGYLFTRYLPVHDTADFILRNFYFNMEYAITSKYTYSRDPNFNYEYVRAEYTGKYLIDKPPTQQTINEVNRIGNFIGYQYGGNADSFDIALGWRSDLWNVKEFSADNHADDYFYSMKKKKFPDRLFKAQIHYRHYRLGDERNVILPYYANDHNWFDEDSHLDSDLDGDTDEGGFTNRRTEFLRVVLEEGHLMDLSFYGDVIRLSSFTIGLETGFNFNWKVLLPYSQRSTVDFSFRWDFAVSILW
jgi:hypothetical protein